MSDSKSQIKIHYVDFWPSFNKEEFIFTKVLKERYNIVFDEKNPDFVFCSHFGTGYLSYSCPRILFLGEAKAPDFNVYDYAIAFDDIIFGDRYLRYPLCITYEEQMKKAMLKHTYSDDFYLSKEGFCNQVISNSSGDKIRDEIFDALSQYREVASGGKYRNNMPDGKRVDSKEDFQKKFRFSLAIENSSFPGYVTEKIIDAFAAGTIPIYWGDKDIAKCFNPESFIDLSSCKDVNEMVEKVKAVDMDEQAYMNMMKAPAIRENDGMYKMMKKEYLSEFLYHIFDQDKDMAYRRNSVFTMWGKAYEHHLKQWSSLESKWWFKKLRNIRRKING